MNKDTLTKNKKGKYRQCDGPTDQCSDCLK